MAGTTTTLEATRVAMQTANREMAAITEAITAAEAVRDDLQAGALRLHAGARNPHCLDDIVHCSFSRLQTSSNARRLGPS